MRLHRGLTLSSLVLAVALLAAGILPDDRALLDAARRGDVAAVRAALKDGADVNAAQGDGLTGLHLAAQSGSLEVAKVLLAAGAKADAKTRIGAYTPLHLASQGAHLLVVRALLDAGADVKAATTNTGVTPLHLAAQAIGGEATVAELVPDIVDWAKGPMAAMTGDSLSDPRVAIRFGDVGDAIVAGRGQYDAILLDVDNGPDGLVRAENNRLYSADGLAAAKAALRLGGILAIWSAGSDPAFTRRLKQAGFTVDEQVVRARQNGKGPRHTIWFAKGR